MRAPAHHHPHHHLAWREVGPLAPRVVCCTRARRRERRPAAAPPVRPPPAWPGIAAAATATFDAVRPIAPPPPPLDDLGLVPRCPDLSLGAVDAARLAPLVHAASDAASEAVAAAAAASAAPSSSSSSSPSPRLLGVYLRGSVPRGLFIEGVSDVDAVALVVVDAAPGAAGAADGGSSSTAAALERAATAALALRLERDAEASQAAALTTKVELRVHVVDPLLEEAAVVASAAAAAAAADPTAPSPPSPLPPSLVRRTLPRALAFELATAAIATSGSLDLPALLPDVARLPPAPSLLTTIAADVRRAVAASARDAEGEGGGAAPRRAARWALKRCVRAALELQFCTAGDQGGSGGGSGGATGGAAAAAGLKQQQRRRWTRDLYHCAALTRAAAESGACALSARVADAVDEALRLYVGLSRPVAGGCDDDNSDDDSDGGKESVRRACAHAERLADALDAAFLAAMLSEAPGWLTRHAPSRERPRSGGATAGDGGGGGRGWPRWPFGTLSAAPASAPKPDPSSVDNIAAPGESPLLLVGCDPPPVYVPISGPPRLQFDWGRRGDDSNSKGAGAATAAAAAADALAAALMLPRRRPRGEDESSALLPPQPVLLRGFAKDWPATRRWSFASLLGSGDEGPPPLRGKARAAPSLAFPFCEPALRDVLVAARGPASAPSLEVDDLLASDFVRAMLLRPLLPLPPPASLGRLPRSWERAYLYLQAVLPDDHPMHADVREGLRELLSLLESPEAAGAGAVRVAQPPRLWASCRGSVSPTHYDSDASLLVQVVGRKRMLLFDPDQLECLSPYPDQHLLRRRARVNVAARAGGEAGGGRARAPTLRSRLSAVEVVLGPGDAVFFPPEWAHYTESLTPSMSVTTRFAAAAGAAAAAAG